MFSTKILAYCTFKVVNKRRLIYMSSRHRALTFIWSCISVYLMNACPKFTMLEAQSKLMDCVSVSSISSSSTYLLLAEPYCQHLFWRLGFSWRENIFFQLLNAPLCYGAGHVVYSEHWVFKELLAEYNCLKATCSEQWQWIKTNIITGSLMILTSSVELRGTACFNSLWVHLHKEHLSFDPLSIQISTEALK